VAVALSWDASSARICSWKYQGTTGAIHKKWSRLASAAHQYGISAPLSDHFQFSDPNTQPEQLEVADLFPPRACDSEPVVL
jgi:hypothetical protein